MYRDDTAQTTTKLAGSCDRDAWKQTSSRLLYSDLPYGRLSMEVRRSVSRTTL